MYDYWIFTLWYRVVTVVAHMARMQLQWYKDNAEENLLRGSLSEALNLYNGALTHCNMNSPILQDEVPKILSNRSLVFSKMGNFELALTDAGQCMEIVPYWAKVKFHECIYKT